MVQERDPGAVRRIPAVHAAHIGADVVEALLSGVGDHAGDVTTSAHGHRIPVIICICFQNKKRSFPLFRCRAKCGEKSQNEAQDHKDCEVLFH
ncbi:hypothetical protein D3C75_1023780 [compost metagenome]